MRRVLKLVLAACVLCSALAMPAFADVTRASGLTVTYDLTSGGTNEVTAKSGDVITVTFTMRNTDSTSYQISTLQNEIIFDQTFFEYVEDSAAGVRDGAAVQRLTRQPSGQHIIQSFFVSAQKGGTSFDASTVFCTFQLKIIGTTGSGVVQTDAPLAYDGNTDYIEINVQNLTVHIDADTDPGIDSGTGTDSGNSAGKSSGSSKNSTTTDAAATETPAPTEEIDNSAVPLTSTPSFIDVSESDWYHTAVSYVAAKGWFEGTAENTFTPNGPMTRAMFATVLLRISGEDASGITSCRFDDVEDSAWYMQAVEWGAARNLILGVGGNKFDPNSALTREQMVVLFYRYLNNYKSLTVTGEGTAMSSFSDDAAVSDWASAEMAWATERGVIKGTGNRLAPGAATTRAEASQLITNIFTQLDAQDDGA
ncbi:MAG: S-layer homology domain-containing protein [Oscillospiraceae bacterium]|nr:S-layer homology domain-containing protein [Oscillospiraceae bacterium]